MDILIIYDSKTGTTKKCSNLLAEKIIGGAEVKHIDEMDNVDIGSYKKVIIGSYINIGSISSKIKKFCSKNIDILLQKQIALFLCMGAPSSQIKEYINKNYDKRLTEHAIISESFGGEYILENAKGFLEKLVIKTAIKRAKEEEKQLPTIIIQNIEKFANVINNF